MIPLNLLHEATHEHSTIPPSPLWRSTVWRSRLITSLYTCNEFVDRNHFYRATCLSIFSDEQCHTLGHTLSIYYNNNKKIKTPQPNKTLTLERRGNDVITSDGSLRQPSHCKRTTKIFLLKCRLVPVSPVFVIVPWQRQVVVSEGQCPGGFSLTKLAKEIWNSIE